MKSPLKTLALLLVTVVPPVVAVAQVDEAIRKGMRVEHDCLVVGGFLSLNLAGSDTGFKQPVPPMYFECMSDLAASRQELLGLRPDDPLRSKAVAEILRAVVALEKSLGYFKSALDGAVRAQGWSRSAREDMARSSAAYSVAPKEAIDTLCKDGNFLSTSPEWFRQLLDARTRPQLRIGSWAKDTLAVVWVEPNGLGAAMGLRSGDRITGLDGKAVASMADLKARLRELDGQGVTIQVQRGGGVADLRWKVELPK